jgi:flavorubredoxin
MTMTVSRPEMYGNIDTSAYAPMPPQFHHEPLKVADDTYMIRTTFGEGHAPQFVYVNSLVVLGEEPAIIDTGTVNNRKQWLDDVFSLVDPKDVRWIMISHDDHDHVGNLAEAMALCPNATLVSSWFQVERLAGDIGLPPTRMQWREDGDSIKAGDREFALIRPPAFDSPTTRGFYDSKTGVYWAGDCFATPSTVASDDVSVMQPEEWRQGFNQFQLAISPWIHLVDAVKYNRTVKRIADLDPKVIVGGHSPAIFGDYVSTAIDMMYDLPAAEAPQLPGQETLDMIVAQITGAAAK